MDISLLSRHGSNVFDYNFHICNKIQLFCMTMTITRHITDNDASDMKYMNYRNNIIPNNIFIII